MVHRIQLKRREQQETLQSHWLVPVFINKRGPFLFAVEPSRSRTVVSASTIEGLGVAVDKQSNKLAISGKLAYPLVQLQSVAVGDAVLNDFEVVVWGRAAIPTELLAEMHEDVLYPLGKHPLSAVDSILECRGVLGLDFLRHFKVSLDFAAETLALEQ